MGETCLNIGAGGGGGNGETPRHMQIPIRHMKRGKTYCSNPNPKFEERERRRAIKALQRPPRGIDAMLAARGIQPDCGFLSRVQKLGLSMEDVAPFLNAFKSTTMGTNAEVEGGFKGPATDPSEPIGMKAEGMRNYPLKSLPASESLVVDTNPAPDSAA